MATRKSALKASGIAEAASLAASDPLLANLQKIDHIVILAMENRSFDQMLGYLSLEAGRTDVNGLKGGERNSYRMNGAGPLIAVDSHHAASTSLGKNQDPCHAGTCVDQQVADANGGFVQNFHDAHPDDPDPGLVMGHFNASDVPVYDFLAREFSISDSWFSSVAGSTWPNRLYLTSGMAAGSRDNKANLQYRNKSWVRQLDASGVSWKGYGDGFLTHCSIRFSDQNYRSSPNFEPFSGSLTGFGFIRDAETGNLPAVSLIDPAFFKNDDHPPADVAIGQNFVARAYNALANSPAWNRTLFIVLYDEHGGFFDHVPPGQAADDDPNFRNYGPRVPAFFVGPYVGKGNCFHTTCDHASIVKTILLRFCARAGQIPDMGARVAGAAHLGEVLSETTARPARPLPSTTIRTIAKRHVEFALAEFDSGRIRHEPSHEELAFIKAARQIQEGSATRVAAGKKSKAGRPVEVAGRKKAAAAGKASATGRR
jgi:phospholipase C